MSIKKLETIKDFLDKAYLTYHKADFIENDPICIPHKYTKKQDIEIAAFFTCLLAWGNRKSIINSCKKLMQLFDQSPHDFIVNHKISDLKALQTFKHRTFNSTDLLYLVYFLKKHYIKNKSLESAFVSNLSKRNATVEQALISFKKYVENDSFFPKRTGKHIATPIKKSACKRLNMFLRWMVREDTQGIDFGLWKQIKPSQLLIPYDVHVQRKALQLNLLKRKQRDFLAVLELSKVLSSFDYVDPIKYDFALFGLGVDSKNIPF